MINWRELNPDLLNKIDEASGKQPVLIFKNSNRCAVSSMALMNLEDSWVPGEMKKITPYMLDIISYRQLSKQIEEKYGVRHESPQLLLIANGQCVYHTSHMGIRYETMKKKLQEMELI